MVLIDINHVTADTPRLDDIVFCLADKKGSKVLVSAIEETHTTVYQYDAI